MNAAIADCALAVRRAGFPVSGASERMQAALDRKNDLWTYTERVLWHLEQETFYSLPHPRLGSQILAHQHMLTIGVWRGIFLLDPAGELVVGLVFSEAPHDMAQRVAELAAAQGARR